MQKKTESGWVIIRHESDEFYGQVQWRDKNGNMTDRKETVELNWPKGDKYRFCKAGMGELKTVK